MSEPPPKKLSAAERLARAREKNTLKGGSKDGPAATVEPAPPLEAASQGPVLQLTGPAKPSAEAPALPDDAPVGALYSQLAAMSVAQRDEQRTRQQEAPKAKLSASERMRMAQEVNPLDRGAGDASPHVAVPAYPKSKPKGVLQTEAGLVFVPSYEWCELPEDINVPAGLDIELPLDGAARRARIPPSWQLRLWTDDEHGYWRQEVTRSTTGLELRARRVEMGRRPGSALAAAHAHDGSPPRVQASERGRPHARAIDRGAPELCRCAQRTAVFP